MADDAAGRSYRPMSSKNMNYSEDHDTDIDLAIDSYECQDNKDYKLYLGSSRSDSQSDHSDNECLIDDDDGEEEEVPMDNSDDADIGDVSCVWCPRSFASCPSCWRHVQVEHGFPGFKSLTLSLGRELTFYDKVRIVNYLRRHENDDLAMTSLCQPGCSVWFDELYLRPVLEDDRLLWDEDD